MCLAFGDEAFQTWWITNWSIHCYIWCILEKCEYGNREGTSLIKAKGLRLIVVKGVSSTSLI